MNGEPVRVANGTDKDGKEQFLANALPDKEATDEVVAQLEKAKWTVRWVEKKERRRNPSAPYTTSKLQQDASSRLGFNVRRTMGVAQRLYEGVEIGNEGTVGLITYMRTDSTRVCAGCDCGGARVYRQAGRGVSAGEGERVRGQEEGSGAGRARGDSADECGATRRSRFGGI